MQVLYANPTNTWIGGIGIPAWPRHQVEGHPSQGTLHKIGAHLHKNEPLPSPSVSVGTENSVNRDDA